MADNRSRTAIYCSESNERVHQFISIRQLIFGWDIFNFVTWMLLLALFCIWSTVFFCTYEVQSEDANNEHH
ncbi:hypothetical protein X777_07141 [Ooceraea biroi]|uniref:Uncharacterized protein n=1 Tax=Ooceraea biroi TaxID=2015173 RepID=A0A026W9N8_OOCBI|nr:hypothetical protein X777_07141 [Ooceraea biroi]